MTAELDPLRVNRLPERQVFDRDTLYRILDEALVAHVALVRAGSPIVLPFGCARDRDSLLLHGSTGAGLLREAAAGAPLAAAVTHLDGLVFATSLFESSMNYRSAMIAGVASSVLGDEKVTALRVLSEHLMPGRWDEVRPPSRRELAATLILRLPLDQASVKIRNGPAGEEAGERDSAVWSGVVPLSTASHAPVSDGDGPEHAPPPASVQRAAARWTSTG